MEFLKKNRIIVLRIIGGLLLFISFLIYFWSAPQKSLSQNERAAANVARIEAKIKGNITTQKHKDSKFLQTLKKTQDKQLRYMLIFFMTFGFGFLGYSFIKRD